MSQDNGAHVEDGATTDASLASRAKNPKSTAVKVNRRLSTEIRKKWLFIAMAQITGRN